MANPTEDDLRVAKELVTNAIKRRVSDGSVVGKPLDLIDAIASMRAVEREKAAKECDVVAKRYSGGTFNDSSREVRAAEECAAAIRAGDK